MRARPGWPRPAAAHMCVVMLAGFWVRGGLFFQLVTSAQTNPASSRAIAVTVMPGGLPRGVIALVFAVQHALRLPGGVRGASMTITAMEAEDSD